MFMQISAGEFENIMNTVRPNHFSRQALSALYKYFEEYENNTNTQIEFDPISICGEWSEYTPEEFKKEFDVSIDELREYTTVLEASNGNIVVYTNYSMPEKEKEVKEQSKTKTQSFKGLDI